MATESEHIESIALKKQKKRRHFKTRACQHQRATGPRTIKMELEELVTYVRRAEQAVLPIIKEKQLGPGAAQFFLAQYTAVFVSGNNGIELESGMEMWETVLALWQGGFYTPGPEYPFTLEETLQDIEAGGKARGDYAESFQVFTPVQPVPPGGLRQVAGGIVKHPDTQLWQIWILVEGPCAYFGAYRDPVAAQRGLEELINLSRSERTQEEGIALYYRLSRQGDGEPKELPYDMLAYILDHLDRFMIEL